MIVLPFMLIVTLGGYLKLKEKVENNEKKNPK